MNMKNTKELMQFLSNDIRERIIKNADPEILREDFHSLSEFLYHAFVFDQSPEGSQFWTQIANGS